MVKASLRFLMVISALMAWSSTLAAESQPSIDVKIPNQFLPVGSEFSFDVEAHGLPESSRSSKASLASALVLKFPGFEESARPRMDQKGAVTFRGRITRPGFFPFQVSLETGGPTYQARDYVVTLDAGHSRAFDHSGYYVFLGRGDYWDETHKLALWRLEDWENLIDWMSAHSADTLFCLLNGYTLAYPSGTYPELRDKFSLNARYNFLGKLIDYAHSRNVKVYLTLTTDDHAEGFGKLHPETVRVNRDGFKTASRALCLENEKVKRYITDIFNETLALYPGADGVVIHPSEEDPDRYNDETKEAFYRDTGAELTHATKEERYRWYNETYARFVTKLYDLVAAKRPAMGFIMFNCWWQDGEVPIYKRMLPEKVRICVWYYGWDDVSYRKWPVYAWTDNFGPERTLFMPTGPAFLYPTDPWQQLERHIGTDRLASTVEAMGIKSCIVFAGWDVGTEVDRIRDTGLTEFPTTFWVRDKTRKLDVVKSLYEDYWRTREAVLH